MSSHKWDKPGPWDKYCNPRPLGMGKEAGEEWDRLERERAYRRRRLDRLEGLALPLLFLLVLVPLWVLVLTSDTNKGARTHSVEPTAPAMADTDRRSLGTSQILQP